MPRNVLFVCSRNRLRSPTAEQERFRAHLGGKRIVCLEIPDDFDYMEPALVRLLQDKVPRHLR